MDGSCLQYFLVFLLLRLLCMRTTVGNNSSLSNVTEFRGIKCILREKQALLKFKGGLVDRDNQLSSWDSKEEDCCKWRGVWCNEKSSHVYGLDLRPTIDYEPSGYSFMPFKGEISSSLLELPHLTYLDMSMFDGSETSIPEFIGSLKNLRYLNFSQCYFTGKFPHQLGNLSRLVSLDLSSNSFYKVESLAFLYQFAKLKHLDLSGIDLSQAIDWLQAINMLPSLLNLHLRYCNLSSVNPLHLSLPNSSKSLTVIDLSYNSRTSSIFTWLFNFNNSLVSQDLERNELHGSIPYAFEAMISLKHLNIADNNLEGEIPRSFGNLRNLETLDLSRNNLTGEFPDLRNVSLLEELHLFENKLNWSLSESTGLLSSLKVLDLSSNYMDGFVSEIHLSNLSQLQHLDISAYSHENELMRSGASFSTVAAHTKEIIHLDISNTTISDRISDQFWEIAPTLRYLNLSGNQISGEVQKLPSILGKFPVIDMSSNCFHGSIPQLPPDTIILNLSRNRFSGTTSNLCSISGSQLNYLDLSDNSLSGELPDCWMNWKQMSVINLENNNFSGTIPVSFGLLPVETLHLRNNSFSGELPGALANCTGLKILDLGENRLSGRIPAWLGENLSNLIVLRLRSNRFYGTIPLQLCHLASIQILDLSHNRISGSIGRCISNFTAMAKKGGTVDDLLYTYYSYPLDELNPDGLMHMVTYAEHIVVAWKGLEFEYGKTFGLVKCIDFSSNNMTGKIPSQTTVLAGLISLNLSNNRFSGIIPRMIGRLSSLESLDLSENNLSGSLPEGLADLNFLSYLNLSDNDFSGKIPTSTQIQSFDDTTFKGNSGLCGKPLPNMCPGEQIDNSSIDEGSRKFAMQDEQDEIITSGFYISMGVGFAAGFWGVCGTLLLYRSGRHAYFRFLDTAGRWLYVRAVVSVAKLLRMF